MKKLFSGCILVTLTVLLTGCGKVDVTDYNDKLVEFTDKCFTAEALMQSALQQENYAYVKELHTTALETCTAMQKETVALEAYKNDTSFRNATDTLLQALISYLQKFGELFPYRENTVWTPEQETAYITLEKELGELEKNLQTLNKELEEVQKTFATTYGYEIEE
ncbi:MAG: hypothetical protein LBP53_00480 [Candidatus Peribacteria bacterium]|jgi:predicted AlkP superfamily phosphohydrolase/phosphomutase|nr:hypothetical protein [Candidatus Peribacteria bacterium]